jgi:hypothetical protein
MARCITPPVDRLRSEPAASGEIRRSSCIEGAAPLRRRQREPGTQEPVRCRRQQRPGIVSFADYAYGDDLNELSTVNRLVRLSDTPVWATFSVAPAAAVVSTL